MPLANWFETGKHKDTRAQISIDYSCSRPWFEIQNHPLRNPEQSLLVKVMK